MSAYDAIIIGSGPNGLAAAIHLAKQGKKTLILEASDTVGGGMRTKELTLPGFRHDVCSAVHPMGLASPFFRSLELEKHGLKWLQPEVPLAHPLDDGREAVLFQSLEQTCLGLGIDGARYRRFFAPLIEHAHNLYGDLLAPAGIPKHPFTVARFGIGAALPATLFAKYFQSTEARALFAGNAAHSVMPLENLLTSAIGLMLQMSAHAVGWPMAKGGSQSLADTLLRIFESHGGEVQCSRQVKSLEELPTSKAYLFDLSPRNLAKITGEALPLGYRQKLLAFRHGPGVFKVDYALSAAIPWQAENCRKAGTVHVGGTLEEITASERDAWEGRHSEKPFTLVVQPTICDPTRAPEGKHVAWAYCHVPHGSTKDMLETINSQIERFAPGFRDGILATHIMNCEAMEAYNANYIGGDVVGGITDWRQLFTRPVARWNPYTTPNPKIFLCSASTPPGGGVHGMCGYWAAETALTQIR
ncbi:NAD(P)/FAD-dependent oxidoreductase [soil metagenome]